MFISPQFAIPKQSLSATVYETLWFQSETKPKLVKYTKSRKRKLKIWSMCSLVLSALGAGSSSVERDRNCGRMWPLKLHVCVSQLITHWGILIIDKNKKVFFSSQGSLALTQDIKATSASIQLGSIIPAATVLKTHRSMAVFLLAWVPVGGLTDEKIAPWQREGARRGRPFWCDLWMLTKVGSQMSGADCGKCVVSAFTGCDHFVYHIPSHSPLLCFIFKSSPAGYGNHCVYNVWSD